jgi:hypothetical protein
MEGQRLPLPHLPARLSSETVVLMTVQRFALDTSLNHSEMTSKMQTLRGPSRNIQSLAGHRFSR